jgi:hypothetical protein
VRSTKNGGKIMIVKNRYLEFLCDLVGNDHRYDELLNHLFRINFYSLVPNDDNRGEDGKQLRDIFIEEEGLQRSSSLPTGPCRVLEMLIGVANRLEFELLGGDYERPARDWFWVLINNLNLELYTNDAYSQKQVDDIVLTFLDRQYSENGYGGLFPLSYPQKDQRRVEIWYQMSAWVIENYPI